jgi:hypothetical protein
MGATCSPKDPLIFNGPHSGITQKTEIFLTNAVLICWMNSHTLYILHSFPRIPFSPLMFNPSHSFLTSCFALDSDKTDWTALKTYCHILGVRDCRRGIDWWVGFIDHLYTPLGTTLHSSPTQTSDLSLLQSPLVVSWQRLLPREFLQLPAFSSSCHKPPLKNSCQLTTQLTGSEAGGHFPPTS